MSDKEKTLETLYPFLHGKGKNVVHEDEALAESIRQKAAQSVAEKEKFFQENAQELIDMSKAIASVYRNKGKILAMGNGGSSCDSAHFAVEFQHPVTAGRPALAAINLASDNAMMSAIANDVGADYIFSRQLEALAHKGDALIGFSTSGNSKNLIEAFRKAKQMDLLTIGFAGGDGGAMTASGLVDFCLVVRSDSIHRVQEVHVTAYHIIWDLVHTLLADHRGFSGTQDP